MKDIFLKRLPLFILVFLLFHTCEEESTDQPRFTNKITIVTEEADTMKGHFVEVTGRISATYGEEIEQFGHCWDTIPNPEVNSNATRFGKLENETTFTSTLSNLCLQKRYYVRAYFSIGGTVVYSEQTEFFSTYRVPLVITDSVKITSENSAWAVGSVLKDGGKPVLQKGFYWSLLPRPTINDSDISGVEGPDTFSATIEGLTPNRDYYIRAYAINAVGTAYGKNFFIRNRPNDTYGSFIDCRDSTVYQWIKIGNQVWMSENLRYLPANSNGHVVFNANDAEYHPSFADQIGVYYTRNQALGQDICPCGWRLPTRSDWEELFSVSGRIANGLITQGWNHLYGGSNTTGFHAIPSGEYYRSSTRSYRDLGFKAYYWAATSPYLAGIDKSGGFFPEKYEWEFDYLRASVRCLKED